MPRRGRRPSGTDSWLRETTSPVFLVDDRRRLRFFNSGCELLTGWQSADLTGRTCDYASAADPTAPESVLGSLAPPPEVYHGQQMAVPAFVPRRAGSPVPRTIVFLPLKNEAGGIDSVLGLIVEIPPPAGFGSSGLSQQLHAELAALRNTLRQKYRIDEIIACSPAMLRSLEQAYLASRQPVSVCLTGETGTGRELMARAIHYHGEQRSLSFVPLDCRAMGAAELKQTVRRLLREATEQAPAQSGGPPVLRPGTVFLKSVEQLPRDIQQMVVDAMQPSAAGMEHERPLLRLMISASAPLEQLCRDELLLEPFALLASVLTIHLPPLRDRPQDLAPLVQHFVETGNRGADRQLSGLSEAAWNQLREYAWPGNIDELRTVLDEARELCEGTQIDEPHLPFRFRTGMDAQQTPPAPRPPVVPLAERLAEVEREHIRAALESVRYNRSRAARLLGLTRARLYRRMEALGIADTPDNA